MPAKQVHEMDGFPDVATTLEGTDGVGADQRLVELEAEVAQLQRGLETRTQIAVAVGILAERHGCTPGQAWALMRRVSSHTNIKIREIGRLLVAVAEGGCDRRDAAALARLAEHLPHLVADRAVDPSEDRAGS